MLFRRKRRVPCTRGFLRERAVGSVPHTGAHTGLFLGWDGYFPYPGKKLRTQGHTGRNRRDWFSFRW